MKQVVFVACSKTKLPFPAPAAALYASPLFRKSLLAALDSGATVYILSALHGILPLAQNIEPYDLTLKTMSSAERQSWASKIGDQMTSLVRPGDVVTFYSGKEYTKPLSRILSNLGCRTHEPLSGLSLGQRLAALRLLNAEDGIAEIAANLLPCLKKLWRGQKGGRAIEFCKGNSGWPRRGLYLILEGSTSPARAMPRIVRIGTHAVSSGAKSSLWNRLSTHKGTTDGRGSHRSSIFRSHVGHALSQRVRQQPQLATWGKGQSAPLNVRNSEVEMERQVSAYIGKLKVLWLDIPDEPGADSDRSYLERNLISVLSRRGILSPSSHRQWLGERSPEWRIAASGLWNLDHLFIEPDPEFVEIFSTYVDITLGKQPQPGMSLARKGWRQRRRAKANTQMSFFENGGPQWRQ